MKFRSSILAVALMASSSVAIASTLPHFEVFDGTAISAAALNQNFAAIETGLHATMDATTLNTAAVVAVPVNTADIAVIHTRLNNVEPDVTSNTAAIGLLNHPTTGTVTNNTTGVANNASGVANNNSAIAGIAVNAAAIETLQAAPAQDISGIAVNAAGLIQLEADVVQSLQTTWELFNLIEPMVLDNEAAIVVNGQAIAQDGADITAVEDRVTALEGGSSSSVASSFPYQRLEVRKYLYLDCNVKLDIVLTGGEYIWYVTANMMGYTASVRSTVIGDYYYPGKNTIGMLDSNGRRFVDFFLNGSEVEYGTLPADAKACTELLLIFKSSSSSQVLVDNIEVQPLYKNPLNGASNSSISTREFPYSQVEVLYLDILTLDCLSGYTKKAGSNVDCVQD